MIYFRQYHLLLAKTNEDRTTSRKVLYHAPVCVGSLVTTFYPPEVFKSFKMYFIWRWNFTSSIIFIKIPYQTFVRLFVSANLITQYYLISSQNNIWNNNVKFVRSIRMLCRYHGYVEQNLNIFCIFEQNRLLRTWKLKLKTWNRTWNLIRAY